MKTMQFETDINASPEKVWDVLWSDKTYREWTSAFSEGSHAVTDWKKGSKVLFLDGKNTGMVSEIAENIPNEYMSIRHLGEYLDGKEDFDSDRVKQWAGAMENYTLKATGSGTHLHVSCDIDDEFEKMFSGMWPKAMHKIQEVAERK